MRNIEATIICDSCNPAGVRLTTWVLTYPRFIHAEFMTHRSFSRNAASSRAIPIGKMIEAVRDRPATFEQWGRNQAGMQASGVLDPEEESEARRAWSEASIDASISAEELSLIGCHKQIANRLLEPFSHITVVATATEHHNFFAQRAHPGAQPEFQVLAFRMLDRYLRTHPVQRGWGDWHLPFVPPCFTPKNGESLERVARVSVACCARVSYLSHEGQHSFEDNLKLYDKLVTGNHWSPFEHVAEAWQYGSRSQERSNFHSTWRQLRKDFAEENRTETDLHAAMAAKPEWISL